MLSLNLASLDENLIRLGIAGLSAGIALLSVIFTPLSRLVVDRSLQRRQAGYARALEGLKSEHALALARHNADIEYEMEQRKALRAEVGSFRGRLIEVGNALNFRLDNMRENRREVVDKEECSEAWLARGGNYRREGGDGYYFASTVYRFMAFAAVGNRFERAAVFVDPRYAEETDEQVMFYVRALRWVLTDPKLFKGVEPPYEQHDATDHFFTDDLRRMCAEMEERDRLKEMHDVELLAWGPLQPVLTFFDGLEPGSLRWDRLMTFSLVLKAFLNTIGYEQVRSTQEWFDKVAASIQRDAVRQNLLDWMERLAIDKGEAAECVRAALASTGVTDPSPVPVSSPAVDSAEPQA